MANAFIHPACQPGSLAKPHPQPSVPVLTLEAGDHLTFETSNPGVAEVLAAAVGASLLVLALGAAVGLAKGTLTL